MKLISWNVNGIRAATRKGLIVTLKTLAADVYCLQEIRADDGQIPAEISQLANFELIVFPGTRPGYAGTAILTGLKPKRIKLGIGSPDFDAVGRTITIEFDRFVLINAYFPHPGWAPPRRALPGGGLVNLKRKMAYCAAFDRQLAKIKKPVIIAADFNVAHTELDLARPRQNEGLGMFTKVERDWFSKLLDRGFVDAFRLFNQSGGNYTWWSNRAGVRAKNIGWRLDYFVVSKALKSKIKSCRILPNIKGSDHCPIELDTS